ncbi:pyridoxal phosphate-dependent decarboxylase family protein [Reichenbachiella versicolor]|uniref:pyridoxal phosphate-dependent decarboxylase family protein n=1 Tax=Reichenbachiella versicolor TaxID=1821036 RepID=UPI000D6E50E5|nr:pyridoxal-dependent decarboxylase [Reichenbachiella versicolor]
MSEISNQSVLSPVQDKSYLIDFFEPRAKEKLDQYIQSTTQYIKGFLSRKSVHSGKSPEYLRLLHQESMQLGYRSRSLTQALAELKELFLDNTVAYHHPSYLSHLNCPVVLPAVIGDIIASSVNTAIETWDQSTSGTLMEQEMIDWITSRIGLSDDADGVFTTGGSQSNLMALLLARDHYAFENYQLNIKESGINANAQNFKIFCSEKSHFSIQKSAALIGLGYESVVTVATDEHMCMDIKVLKSMLDQSIQAGDIPIAVVATLGTTDYGSFDPLNSIAELANEYGLWLHVDGAYGGCFALTETHKRYFKGIEHINSMTIDFHKSFFQPVCSSVLLINDKEHFRYISHHADYLNPLENKNEDMPDLIEKSIQTTRRFDALKLWMTLRVIGEEKMISYLEDIYDLTLETYEKAKNDQELEFIHEPTLTTLVFRYLTPNVSDETIHERVNKYIKNVLYESGQVSIASTRHEGRFYLKFTLLDPNLSSNHLLSVLDIIKEKGQEYQLKN